MSAHEFAHLELLSEVDALMADLGSWAERAPEWPAARSCQAIVRRLAERADTLRVRLDAPLVVATLGGTGTGKSTLVNALVGGEVTEAGRQRPTTRQPTLICRSDVSPEVLGIDPASVHLVQRDLPALRDLVLLDCPDPDTTEELESAGTNLARLRELLPHCDVLLVTTTQQKYRSARVAEELAGAAPGARLVFVQTHADLDEDVREDWRTVLAGDYAGGEIFFVDSVAALADSRAGLQPRGEFARLLELLTRELAGAAGQRIRRANFLDLVEQALSACGERIDAALPAVDALEAALAEQRSRLADRLAIQMREELLTSRREWEGRLLGEVSSRWGFSPFSLVLRACQGLGWLASGAFFWRARTPAQAALWGAFGNRLLGRRQPEEPSGAAATRAMAWTWDESELRTAAIIVEGYVADAGLPRDDTDMEAVARNANEAGAAFVSSAATELQTTLGKLAARHTGWFTRWRYELALLAMLGFLFYRLGRNFFYDSWLAPELGWSGPTPVLGIEFFVQAAFWLAAWCFLLLWAFTGRLRRGLGAEIDQLALRWKTPFLAAGIFRGLETRAREIRRYRQDWERLAAGIAALRQRLAEPQPRLGHRVR